MKKKKSQKKSRSRTSSSKGKGKEKESENSTFENAESENPEFEILQSSFEEERNLESGDNHSKRMSELEKHLEALANWSNLQEVGVVKSYLAEWDAASFPPKFKSPTLHTFDGKGSLIVKNRVQKIWKVYVIGFNFESLQFKRCSKS